MAPEAFIEKILVQGLGVQHLAVGDDFRFGRERRGDFAMLQQAGVGPGVPGGGHRGLVLKAAGEQQPHPRTPYQKGICRVRHGLLGRPYGLSGRVMYGEQLGRKLGFPTANMALLRHLAPVGGIFAARVHGLGDSPKDATAYVGHRPAVDGTQTLLETHLLDFSGELYGRKLEVELLQRLREDRHFDSLDALTAQMQEDVRAARRWLADHKT